MWILKGARDRVIEACKQELDSSQKDSDSTTLHINTKTMIR